MGSRFCIVITFCFFFCAEEPSSCGTTDNYLCINSFYFTMMCLLFLIVVDSYKEQIA